MESSYIALPSTDLLVHPLCLGTNIMGGAASKEDSLAVLDAYAAHGGNFIDSADMYSEWVPGNTGHDSESIIGEWMKSKGNREKMVIATKVSKLSTRPGLSAANIKAAVDDSLAALQTDYIDIYYAHSDDETVPLTETLQAFTELITSGKVRYIAASNYTGARLQEALDISDANGFAKYTGVQNLYNLLDRNEYESDVVKVIENNGLWGAPFYGLAKGFLSGKYTPETAGTKVDTVRDTSVYQDARGWAVIEALRDIAKSHGSSVSAISLAWLRAQKGVTTPIASARLAHQVEEIVQVVELSGDEMALLTSLSNK
jgi:aryl-alcohol dehydrogenase-like predicted oxidoreductase